jgi:predicted ATPase/DNA-binding CsgD family transcriptional regulator
VEPLTHREREILAHLAGDLYSHEIAEALSLAPSSIKWYTRQIYAKLGVNSRKAAIQRARELGLLETKTGPVFHPHTLPAALTPFVGRQAELAQVRQMLADPVYRLLTLTGAGGVGKTRLALQAADELQSNYPQGAWLVELASLSDPELVPQTLAAAFDLRPERDRPILNGLVDYLRNRNLLLVLDNCEHLVAACASLAHSLLLGCPALHILATSREALGIEAERTYLVPSLSFPAPGEKISPQELMKYAAVDLFSRRAKVAQPDFELDEANAAAVTGICRHLDGIPLALELAAARLRAMEMEQIASQLEDRFRLLSGGDRTAPPRLQTMHASIDWSYQLLPQAEKNLLRRLSVFAGGWSLPAAQAVCNDEALPEADLPDLLGRLVDKSLVQVLRRKGQELRYRLLETLRQYAQEKLRDAGELTSTRDRHLAYYVSLAEQAAPELEGANSVTWLRRLEDELDNLRLALEWALANNVESGLRLAGALYWFWFLGLYIDEGVDWMKRTLECADSGLVDAAVRAKVLAQLCGWGEGREPVNVASALLLCKESLALYEQAGNKWGIAFALRNLSLVFLCSTPPDHASFRAAAEKSLALFRELGDKFYIANMLSELASEAYHQGELERAEVLGKEALQLHREARNLNGIARELQDLGTVAELQGDYARAKALYQESRPVLQELGIEGWTADNSMKLAEHMLHENAYEQAAALVEEGLAAYRERGLKAEIAWAFLLLGNATLGTGNYAHAKTLLKESLRMCQERGHPHGVAEALQTLAGVAVAQGQPQRAAHLFGAAEAIFETTKFLPPLPYQVAQRERDVGKLYKALDEEEVKAAWAEGRAMTLEQAIAYALDETPS